MTFRLIGSKKNMTSRLRFETGIAGDENLIGLAVNRELVAQAEGCGESERVVRHGLYREPRAWPTGRQRLQRPPAANCCDNGDCLACQAEDCHRGQQAEETDAAFARFYETLEARIYRQTRTGRRYVRLPLVRYKSCYQAESWSKPRRIVAKVEHHLGELFPRVGFIVRT